ncbi:MAG: hypothetical protein ACXWUG_25945 [Polyangiales bacterium]
MPFSPSIDLNALPQPVQRVIGAAAPAPMRMMAARGAMPGLRPEQIVTVVALLARGDLAHVEQAAREAAEATLAKLPPPVLTATVGSADAPPGILDLLATVYAGQDDVIERIVLNGSVAVDTIARVARTGTERITELVATNEQRLLDHPTIIEALYLNKRTRMSTADRVLELAVRNGKTLGIPAFREAAEAIKDELITAPDAEPTPDDILFAEAQAEGERLDAEGIGHAAVIEDEEGKEKIQEKAKSLEQRIRDMTISQKIRAATLGTAAARALLVRDKNKLVSTAVVRSPLLQENEAAGFAASRSVGEEVLRLIASNGEFTKSHQIKYALVSNPRTPLSSSMRLLPHLRQDELKKLMKSKGVPAQIAKMAKQEMEKKKPGSG